MICVIENCPDCISNRCVAGGCENRVIDYEYYAGQSRPVYPQAEEFELREKG